MQPGPKIGEGAGAEVFAWGRSDALKLFTMGTPRRLVEYEARVTAAAHDAGAPAPEVKGLVEVDGRGGIILPRYDGGSLLRLALRGEVTPAETGRIMATAQHTLHALHIHADVLGFHDWVDAMMPLLHERGVPPHVARIAHESSRALAARGVLCHGDLHPGNILMTAEGPVIIDWISAIDAEPLVDVAREHVTLTMTNAATGGAAAFCAAIHSAFIASYSELSGTTPQRLLEAIKPYVLVMAVMRMTESGCDDAERQSLIEYVGGKATGSTD